MIAERGAVGDRLDDLLQRPVREQRDHRPSRRHLSSSEPSAISTVKAPGSPSAPVGDVGGEGVQPQRSTRRGARPAQARRTDHGWVESGRHCHTKEVAAQGRGGGAVIVWRRRPRDAPVGLSPCPDLGPVLEQEHEAERHGTTKRDDKGPAH